jgi:hypothetical protein
MVPHSESQAGARASDVNAVNSGGILEELFDTGFGLPLGFADEGT